MATRTLNLNTAASTLLGNKSRVRVRVLENGVLEIRPTKRTTGETLLPENEYMRTLTAKTKNTKKISLKNVDLEKHTMLKVEPLKYKWFRLTPVSESEIAANDAYASVSAA